MINHNELYEILINNIVGKKEFSKAVFKGRQRGIHHPWVKVELRPVVIRQNYYLQFSYFYQEKQITKNFTEEEARAELQLLSKSGFSNIYLQMIDRDLQIRISKKGKIFTQHHERSLAIDKHLLMHDRQKDKILRVGKYKPFLESLGLMKKDGKLRAGKQRKFRQINEFLNIFEQLFKSFDKNSKTLTMIDFGCGKGYLTFAVYHYMRNILNIPIKIIGVDVKSSVIKELNKIAKNLGWETLNFVEGKIEDFSAESRMDIVVALHACDTATDDAISQGIKWNSEFIITAPCCHHDLQAQLSRGKSESLFDPVLSDGILLERLGDVLTDSLRAQMLRSFGYKTDVIEFVSPEHTSKNLMIRARKTTNKFNHDAFRKHQKLAKYWRVKPFLETLLLEKIDELKK